MFIRRAWPASSLERAMFPDPARLRRDIDRMFDMLRYDDSATSGAFPALNVTQADDRYIVRAELPGVNTKDLDISVERNKLTLAAKREIPEEGNGVSYHRRERRGGSFSRSLTLPDDLNADAVEAKYRNGVLTLVLPKSEAARARQIKVKAG